MSMSADTLYIKSLKYIEGRLYPWELDTDKRIIKSFMTKKTFDRMLYDMYNIHSYYCITRDGTPIYDSRVLEPMVERRDGFRLWGGDAAQEPEIVVYAYAKA